MSSPWPMVPLGDLLNPATCPQKVFADRSYPNFGIYSFGRGLFKKPPIAGSATSAKTLFRVRTGQFIYSRLFAFEGAYGLVPDVFDGYFISNEYPTFEVDHRRLEPRYLLMYFQRPSTWQEASGLAVGMGDRRRRIQPEGLLRYKIPLPPIAEQRRLVELLDALAARIEEAKTLRRQTNDGLDELCRSILRSASGGQIRPTPMDELVSLREPDVQVKSDEIYYFAGIYCFGGGVFSGQRKTGLEFKYPRLTTLHTNNFVYPKLMAWEGALAVVPPECDGLVVSTEYPVFEINQDKVLPEVLDVYFRTPAVWPELSGVSTGTNVRRRRLNPADFLRYKFPLPPMETQERLRKIKGRVAEARMLRGSSEKELEAMLPTILDRAFNGELLT